MHSKNSVSKTIWPPNPRTTKDSETRKAEKASKIAKTDHHAASDLRTEAVTVQTVAGIVEAVVTEAVIAVDETDSVAEVAGAVEAVEAVEAVAEAVVVVAVEAVAVAVAAETAAIDANSIQIS